MATQYYKTNNKLYKIYVNNIILWIRVYGIYKAMYNIVVFWCTDNRCGSMRAIFDGK